jgi:hypothetical protein
MYTDKDDRGNISIMEISRDEAGDLASLLFEFEHLINRYSILPERERTSLAIVSNRLRFQLVEELNKQEHAKRKKT